MFYSNTKCAFKITGVFYIERTKAKAIREEKRHFAALGYRIKGESRFLCNGECLEASDESVIYIPEGVDYERKSASERLIIIHLKSFEDDGKKIEVIRHAKETEPLFRKILYAWNAKDANAYNKAMQLLYEIFEALQSKERERLDPIPALIQAGVELLQKEYRNPDLRVSDMADACFISEVYFRNAFHKHYGKSPHQLLLEMRFQNACELLTSEYYTQKEIALLSGFSSVKYFRTAFKKHFGMTPSEYPKAVLRSSRDA